MCIYSYLFWLEKTFLNFFCYFSKALKTYANCSLRQSRFPLRHCHSLCRLAVCSFILFLPSFYSLYLFLLLTFLHFSCYFSCFSSLPQKTFQAIFISISIIVRIVLAAYHTPPLHSLPLFFFPLYSLLSPLSLSPLSLFSLSSHASFISTQFSCCFLIHISLTNELPCLPRPAAHSSSCIIASCHMPLATCFMPLASCCCGAGDRVSF